MSLFVQGLSAEEVAVCRNLFAGTVRKLAAGETTWIAEWKVQAGDLTVDTDDDDLVVVRGVDAAAVASVTYAVSRRQIPCLWLGSVDIGLDTELLQCVPEGGADVNAVLEEFITPAAVPGRLFGLEGGDGAGKQTQTAMLVARLSAEGYPVRTLDFPHDAAAYGKKIREILSGKHGGIKEVSPQLFATLYSMNRDDLRPLMKHWIRKGYNVVLDRYMESSFGHQAAKLPTQEEKVALINQLTNYETKWLGLPPAYQVRYLDLDPEVALRALNTDTARKALDIHETARAEYKESVRACFRWCCDTFAHWREMPQQVGMERKSRELVHEELFESLKPHLVNKAA